MNPSKVRRDQVRKLTDLPNIGPAMARDFARLGINEPAELVGADALDLYRQLCIATGTRHDPCVLDVMLSVTDFMAGGEPKPWWHYTAERKRQHGQLPAAAVLPASD